MNSACHSASALLRVAMRRVRLDMALTVVRENVPQGYLVAVKKSRGCPGIPRQGEGWCSCNHWRTWPAWRRLTGSSAGSQDRKSTRLNSSHVRISYAVFCLKKKNAFHV